MYDNKYDLMQNRKNVEERESNYELFRIIAMFCIVAHHYVVNSGILNEIVASNVLQLNSIFSLLFGWGGKTGINCFVLITGYFMCQSNISLRKFLKLVLEVEFYRIIIYLIFLLTGYASFSVNELVKAILPVHGIGTAFTSSYLIFFLFIPYLNILIKAMDERQHLTLIGLCLLVGTILPTFLDIAGAFNYVGWFMVLYFIASYIRLYPKAIFENKVIWGYSTIIALIISWCSVIVGAIVFAKTNKSIYFYFVSDSNKILAIITAICVFLYFKNINIKYNKIINKVAASTFGVLLIHANSDIMRRWLWNDMLQNVKAFQGTWFIIHAITSVFLVYIACTVIDMIRIYIFEKPFFEFFDKRYNAFNINTKINNIFEKIKNT